MNKKLLSYKEEFFIFIPCAYFCCITTFMTVLNILLDANVKNSAASYLPIGLQLFFAAGLVTAIMLVSHLLTGPKRATTDKLEGFSSGIESHGNARSPMAIKYFLVAILFVLFDVEVIFFYPYAVNFKQLGWHGFLELLLFVAFFLAGYIYIIKRGALQWED